MKIKDHFLSQKIFEVKPSKHDGILETFPKPAENKLATYYDSPDYISHQTQAKTLKEHLYQFVKSLMIKRKKKMVLRYHQQGHILDIGAGTGEFLDAFDDQLWTKSAIEPSTKLQENFKQKQIQRVDSLEEFNDSAFEIITLWHSLEHIPNLEDTLKHLKRILKPHGVIFVAVPNHKSYDAQFYKSNWAAWDVPRHLWHFSKAGLKQIFLNHQLKCVKDKGMPFDAFYVSLLSESYKEKGSTLRAFVIGSLSNLKSLFNHQFSSVIYVLKPLKEINDT